MAEAAVSSDEGLEIEGRHFLVVIEEGLEVVEGVGFADRNTCLAEPPQSRSGSVKALSHLVNDGAKRSENVESKTSRFEPGVISRCA